MENYPKGKKKGIKEMSNVDLHGVNMERLEQLDTQCREDEAYETEFDNMDLPGDVKAVLTKLVSLTKAVRGKVLRIGKIVLEYVFKVVKTFPNTVLGVLIGWILALVMNCIPFVGPCISPLILPWFVKFGGVVGFIKDAKSIYQSILTQEDVISYFECSK